MTHKSTKEIYANLDAILRASGSALKHYTVEKNLEALRSAMRKIMSDSYIAGVHDASRVNT